MAYLDSLLLQHQCSRSMPQRCQVVSLVYAGGDVRVWYVYEFSQYPTVCVAFNVTSGNTSFDNGDGWKYLGTASGPHIDSSMRLFTAERHVFWRPPPGFMVANGFLLPLPADGPMPDASVPVRNRELDIG